jgi:hypothetical protein
LLLFNGPLKTHIANSVTTKGLYAQEQKSYRPAFATLRRGRQIDLHRRDLP